MHVPVLVEHDAEVPEWWADAARSGGWLAAHGSQLIDQIRATLGEFDGVSASLVHVVDRPMTADDGFVVHFRMASGCVGTLQSTASDRGSWSRRGSPVRPPPPGSKGWGPRSRWHRPPASGPCRSRPPCHRARSRSPPGSVATAYEQMTTFGVEYGPYTRLASAFGDLILGDAVPIRPRPPSPMAWP